MCTVKHPRSKSKVKVQGQQLHQALCVCLFHEFTCVLWFAWLQVRLRQKLSLGAVKSFFTGKAQEKDPGVERLEELKV